MDWSERRLNVTQIKNHGFFYGADWSTIRRIEPPFVPCLQSSTDTSYFPVEDYADVPNQVEKVEGVGAEQDLAFLGYVVLAPYRLLFHPHFLTGSPSNASLVESRLLAEPIVFVLIFLSLSLNSIEKETHYTSA
jgi:hypothetical protein